MKKRFYLICTLMLVAAALGLLWWWPWEQREPVYDGKPLSYWMYRPLTRRGINYAITDTTLYVAAPMRNRWPQDTCGPLANCLTDTNALPFLIRELSKGADNWKGGKYYRLWLWSKLPEPVRGHLPTPYYNRHGQINAIILLGQIGSIAKASIPALIRVLKQDENPVVREWAAGALGRVGAGDTLAVAALTEALKEANPSVRGYAVLVLGQIGSPAKTSIPALIHLLEKDETPTVRGSAAEALGLLGEGNTLAVAALTGALKEADPRVRGYATNALLKINPEAAIKAGVKPDGVALRKVAVAAAAKVLKEDASSTVRQDAAETLRDIGSGNDVAVWALADALNDKVRLVRQAASNALWHIDPAAATKAGVSMPPR
jgi:hypothetical protein